MSTGYRARWERGSLQNCDEQVRFLLYPPSLPLVFTVLVFFTPFVLGTVFIMSIGITKNAIKSKNTNSY